MTLLEELSTEAVNRGLENGWTREIVKSLPSDPDFFKPFKRAYRSETSMTIKDTKSRKVVGSAVSSGELGRGLLRRVMSNGAEAGNPILTKRVPYRRPALQFLDRRPAYFFAGECGGPFVLVDIKACYASLYTRLTLDMFYRPDTDPPLIGFGKADFPKSDEWMAAKAPRNALWGSLISTHGPEWRHGELVPKAYPNTFFAPDLVGLVYDACHAIALEAKQTFKALSWAVDGGVFRPEDAYAFCAWLDARWGLTPEVRAEGPGWMFGVTSYQIGGLMTLDVKKREARHSEPFDSLRPQRDYQRRWLADVFAGRVE